MVISYVDLCSAANVIQLRVTLNTRRSGAMPLLCLLGKNTHREKAQAYALGAARTLSVNSSLDLLLATISELLPGCALARPAAPIDETGSVTSLLASQALVSLTEISTACRAGEAILLETVNAGTEAILEATKTAEIRAWLDVVRRYDDRTHQHCLTVAGLVASFATLLGFRIADRRRLTRAALLHDIGKARIPVAILNKPDRLTDAEMEHMRLHASIGYDLLVDQGGFDAELLSIVRHHHEYLDGSGYPDGITGVQISDSVRITTICDIFAALIETRAYKAPMDPRKAYEILVDMGSKLDRELLAEFEKVMQACLAAS